MVYGFANKLPYSMDIEQPEYVPADFLNMESYDVETNKFFKFDDRRTFFNTMIHIPDAYRSGILLQLCNIFQKMLLGQNPHNYKLSDADREKWAISKK